VSETVIILKALYYFQLMVTVLNNRTAEERETGLSNVPPQGGAGFARAVAPTLDECVALNCILMAL
jgi:hypothetical protein